MNLKFLKHSYAPIQKCTKKSKKKVTQADSSCSLADGIEVSRKLWPDTQRKCREISPELQYEVLKYKLAKT